MTETALTMAIKELDELKLSGAASNTTYAFNGAIEIAKAVLMKHLPKEREDMIAMYFLGVEGYINYYPNGVQSPETRIVAGGGDHNFNTNFSQYKP